MPYRLLGSVRSPFVRVCRMFMMQNGIDFKFDEVDFVNDHEHAKLVADSTPINKVPVLFVDDKPIFDSRVILSWLIEKHQLQPLTLDQQNLISVINSCMDAGVILFLLRRDGFDLDKNSFLVERNKKRIPQGLTYLQKWAQEVDEWNIPSMSLYSFLYWADKRELISLEDYPQFNSYMKRFASREEVLATTFN